MIPMTLDTEVFGNLRDELQFSIKIHSKTFGGNTMKIEPVSHDPSIEEIHERKYYDNLIGYLEFKIREEDRKMQNTFRMDYETDKKIADANRRRYEAGGKYDPFDQDIICANNQLMWDSNTRKDAAKRIKDYIELMEEPYFGRIDYVSEEDKVVRRYIGLKTISDYVLSWRDPKVGAIYQNADQHVAKDDVLIALKREIRTAGRHYDGYTDLINQYHRIDSWHKKGSDKSGPDRVPTLPSGDQHLVRLLEEYRAKKQVHDIIKSIQQNQYKIISEQPERNILVNGCAGSGKSMVMYHRLSYLGYNHPELMKSERIYAITPSPMFTEEMKPLLHRLELDDIFNDTFTQLLDLIILRYQRKHGILNPYLYLSYSPSASTGDQENINTIVQKIMDASSRNEQKKYLLFCMEHAHKLLESRGFKGFSDITQERDCYNRIAENFRDPRFARKISSEQNILLPTDDPRRFYGKEVFTNNTFADVEAAAKRQYEEGRNRRRYRILTDHYRLFQETFSSQPKKSEHGTVSDLWRIFEKEETIVDLAMLIHVEALVRSVWKCYKEGRFGAESRHLSLYAFYYTAHQADETNVFADATIERICILKYLTEKFGALSNDKTFFFIDEFQNFNPSHIAVLKSVFPNAILNLYGDFDQRISQNGVSSTDELKPIGELSAFEIKENYRNAMEITQYINNVLHKRMIPIGLSGSVTEVSSGQCKYMKDGRTALIFANKKQLRQFQSKYGKSKEFQSVGDRTQKTNDDKILLLTVGQSKGLEFETVYAHPDGMTDNEKYVAFTRALANLFVVTGPLVSEAEESQENINIVTNQGKHIETDTILEVQRLLVQYNEMCISHRKQEEQLMQQITELQNKMLDN